MHRFRRGHAPAEFVNWARKCRNWEQFARTPMHARVGDMLYDRQEHYCAYCECILESKNKGHIEHLERRSDNPIRSFAWDNLFFSCNNADSCGKYKDETHPKLYFRVDDIIDPSLEEPLDFLLYDMNGGVSARDEAHQYRAEETIRIFNLNNSPRLRGIRTRIAQVVAQFLASDPSEEKITEFLNVLGKCDCISVYYSLCGRKMD
jgi:uncharacterized protein (TIGR02646 family)